MTQTPPPPTTQQVGFPPNQSQVNSVSGGLSRQIESWVEQVLNFKQFLDATPDSDLEAAPYNYSADDVALLKSAFNDLSELANVYKGLAAVATAKDFGTFSRRLAGLSLVSA